MSSNRTFRNLLRGLSPTAFSLDLLGLGVWRASKGAKLSAEFAVNTNAENSEARRLDSGVQALCASATFYRIPDEGQLKPELSPGEYTER